MFGSVETLSGNWESVVMKKIINLRFWDSIKEFETNNVPGKCFTQEIQTKIL